MGVSVVHQYAFDCDEPDCQKYIIIDIWRGGRANADRQARETYGWSVGKMVLCEVHRLSRIDNGTQPRSYYDVVRSMTTDPDVLAAVDKAEAEDGAQLRIARMVHLIREIVKDMAATD